MTWATIKSKPLHNNNFWPTKTSPSWNNQAMTNLPESCSSRNRGWKTGRHRTPWSWSWWIQVHSTDSTQITMSELKSSREEVAQKTQMRQHKLQKWASRRGLSIERCRDRSWFIPTFQKDHLKYPIWISLSRIRRWTERTSEMVEIRCPQGRIHKAWESW